MTVSADENGPTACVACGRPGAELTQDPDIFDTWFSSGLWSPSSAGRTTRPIIGPTTRHRHGDRLRHHLLLGRPDDDARAASDRSRAVPTVYLSGLIRDPEGQKMSKTKGNVVDPLAVIDETGADALRFALIHGAAAGQAQRFGRTKLENAQLREQAVERDAVVVRTTGDDPRGRGASAAARWRSRPGRALDAVASQRDRRAGRCRHGGLRVRRGHAAPSTTRSGTSSAIGASNWPRSGWPMPRCPKPPARRPGGRSSRRWTPICASSTR